MATFAWQAQGLEILFNVHKDTIALQGLLHKRSLIMNVNLASFAILARVIPRKQEMPVLVHSTAHQEQG